MHFSRFPGVVASSDQGRFDMAGDPPFSFSRRALGLAAPQIEAGLDDRQLIGSGFLHVVIMDPTQLPGQTTFENAILHERSFGPTTPSDADYAAFARAKARTSWRLGVDSRVVQHLSPHLLRAGDTLLPGGIWRNGIVVGVSGAFAHYD
ncbi:MAG: hypothetical protein ACM3X0_10650 [Bacteroidota bacterium]